MDKDDLYIYSGIYDITKDHMIKSNNKLVYSMEEFLFSVGGDPNCVNLLDLTEYNNKEFIFISYVSLLQRLPDDYAYKCREKSLELPKEIFQKMLIDTILNSHEFSLKRKNIRNNYTSEYKFSKDNLKVSTTNLPNNVILPKYDKLRNTWIYYLYKKLPLKIKIAIRRKIGLVTL